jgi:hypothetical protein
VIFAALVAALVLAQRARAGLAHDHLAMLGLTAQTGHVAQVWMPHRLLAGGEVAFADHAAIRPAQLQLL